MARKFLPSYRKWLDYVNSHSFDINHALFLFDVTV